MKEHREIVAVDLQNSPDDLHQVINIELRKRGSPFNWIVIDVDVQEQKVYVEAIFEVESDIEN